MREMKESVIPFLDKIPSTWEEKPIRYLFKEITAKNKFGAEKTALKFTYGTIIPKTDFDADTDDYVANTILNYTLVTKGVIMINCLNLNFDFVSQRVGLVKDNGAITSAYLAIKPNEQVLPEFANYELKYFDGIKAFHNMGTGVRKTLDFTELGKKYFAFPSITEQKRIVSFLDAKCAEIDTLSADIQSEIDTLEAYKRSIITEAVTKGLDKNVPMKDSGTEWLGDIPAHWETKRGKYVFEQKSDKGNSKSLVLLSPTQNYGVIPQEMYEELSGFSAVKLNEKTDFNSLKTVHKGAFVISLRSFQGGFEYSEYEGVVSPAYQVFYPSVPVCDGYYKYLFKTQVFIDKMNSYTMSLRDGKNIAFADFGRTYIPIPPVEEQKRIAEQLDNICDELQKIIGDKQQQLSVLADYKKSVIYEYVTGKKELTNG